MNKLNWLFTIYSLVALVIIIERLSPMIMTSATSE